MDEVLKAVADAGCEKALGEAVETLDQCIATGIVERALGGEADGLLELVAARDKIIHVIAYSEGETNGQ